MPGQGFSIRAVALIVGDCDAESCCLEFIEINAVPPVRTEFWTHAEPEIGVYTKVTPVIERVWTSERSSSALETACVPPAPA